MHIWDICSQTRPQHQKAQWGHSEFSSNGAGGPLTVHQTLQLVVTSPQIGLAVRPQRPGGEGALLAAADTRVLFTRLLVPRRASEALRLPGCWHFATRPAWRGRLAQTLSPFFYGAALNPVGRYPA